jgi:hypothetical protein
MTSCNVCSKRENDVRDNCGRFGRQGYPGAPGGTRTFVVLATSPSRGITELDKAGEVPRERRDVARVAS